MKPHASLSFLGYEGAGSFFFLKGEVGGSSKTVETETGLISGHKDPVKKSIVYVGKPGLTRN